MIAFINKLQQNALTLVFRHREPDTISATIRGNPGALSGITQIAKVAQLGIRRSELGAAGPACPAETRAKR